MTTMSRCVFALLLFVIGACAQKPVVEAPKIDSTWENDVAAEHNHDVFACYERVGKKKSKLVGELAIHFRVSPAGEISDVKVIQPVDPVLDACVTKVAAAWKFPWHAQRATSQTLYMSNTFKLTRDESGVRHSEFKEESSLDPEEVRVVVKSHTKDVDDCYQRALKKSPKLHGQMVLAWMIDHTGKAYDVKVKKSLDPKVESCIMENMKQWKFPLPPSGQQASVSYPFFFSVNE